MPQLSRLTLGDETLSTYYELELRAEVDFRAMPALAELAVQGVARIGAVREGLQSFAGLTGLTSLAVAERSSAGAVGALLRNAPPSLRTLDIRGWCEEYTPDAEFSLVASQLAPGTQLTRLVGANWGLVPCPPGPAARAVPS